MNLLKLFEIQKELDERIVQEKGLEGQDLMPQKILSLQVELGELANEWRGFKYWSKDQEPRTKVYWGPFELPEVGTYTNPLLEEYVDCLHFILSIGLNMGYTFSPSTSWQSRTTTVQFNDLFVIVAELFESIESDWEESEKQEGFDNLMGGFVGLGKMLGFTWEQIEQAYLDKNKINHQRQESGY